MFLQCCKILKYIYMTKYWGLFYVPLYSLLQIQVLIWPCTGVCFTSPCMHCCKYKSWYGQELGFVLRPPVFTVANTSPDMAKYWGLFYVPLYSLLQIQVLIWPSTGVCSTSPCIHCCKYKSWYGQVLGFVLRPPVCTVVNTSPEMSQTHYKHCSNLY